MAILPIGHDTYEVSALPGSYVAVSKDGVLHGAALVGPSGVVLVPIQPALTSGAVDIVVTKPQHIPYLQQVPAAALAGPYITLDSFTINDEDGNNNGLADYNEEFSVHVTLKNVGSDPSDEMLATLSGSDPYVTLTSITTRNFGVIANGATSTLNDAYSFTVANNAPDQHVAEFELQMTDGSDNWEAMLLITINAPDLSISASFIIDDTGGNNNGQADPGETLNLVFEVSNQGNSQATNVGAILSSANPYLTINTSSVNIAQLNAGATENATFSVSIDEDTPAGTPIQLTLTAGSGAYDASRDFTLVVGLIIEDFESGDFTKFNWTFTGNQPWVITDVEPYEGTFSAKSGAITHSQSSQLILEYEVAASDNISFFRKISSETNYDYLKFYINNTMVGQWSGTVDWGEVEFPVTAGLNTFKWEYMKDGSVSSGSDCAWIDNIKLPPSSSACSSPYGLHATLISSNSAMLNWSSGEEEISWDVLWGLSGFDPENSGTLAENLPAPNYQITDLNPSANYDFYVKSNCADELSSAWSGPASFTTLCAVFNLPFIEIFSTPSVDCWSYPEGQGNWNIGSSYAPPSSQSGLPNAFFGWTPTLTEYSHSLTSPLLDATGMAEVSINYLLFLSNYSSNTEEKLTVEYKSVCGVDWVLLEEFSNEGVGSGTVEFSRENQLLEEMQGKEFQVRFRAHGLNSFNINGWGLDDILLHAIEATIPEINTIGFDEPLMLDGEDLPLCADATQTIHVYDLQVHLGGHADLIAGQNIIFHPGARVMEGGYLWARITSSDDYCDQPASLLASEEIGSATNEKKISADTFLSVFPNPTTGIVHLSFGETDASTVVSIEVYGMLGERFIRQDLPGSSEYEVDLTHMPKGIYFIRVLKGDEMGIEKVIKQ
jgi:hypothetical protein